MSTTTISEHDAAAHTRREIAAHFAGRGGPRADGRMRAHLPSCASCRRHYDRLLLLARLDPAAPSPARRLARGLGIRVSPAIPAISARPAAGPLGLWRRWGLLVPAVLVATVMLLARPRHPDRPEAPPSAGLAARGAPDAAPSFWIYQLDGDAPPRLATDNVRRGGELAFAYSNPTGAAYLMIFGVDDLGTVYWFHPGWLAGQSSPGAVAALPGPGPHELPVAVSHRFAGRHLTIHALFLPQSLSTTAVEHRLSRRSSGASGDAQTAADSSFGDGAIEVRHPLEVLP